MDRFYEILREIFEKELSRKTGWGRIEIMTAFDKSVAIAIARYARERGINID